MKCSCLTISTPSGILPDVPTTQDWKRPTDRELRQQQLDLMRAGSPSAIADCQQRIERILNEITV